MPLDLTPYDLLIAGEMAMADADRDGTLDGFELVFLLNKRHRVLRPEFRAWCDQASARGMTDAEADDAAVLAARRVAEDITRLMEIAPPVVIALVPRRVEVVGFGGLCLIIGGTTFGRGA
jgi:hypothetical protein